MYTKYISGQAEVVESMSNFYVYQIRSRNKDNKDVPNFKERTKTIL